MNVKWLFNRCRCYEADLTLLAADALMEEQRLQVEAHLENCPMCQFRLAELKSLTNNLGRDGENLPQVEPSAALTRRWMSEVRASARRESASEAPAPPIGLSSRRLAWGSVAAIWLLILFFHLSAPDAPRPEVTASSPPSLREVLLALKVQPRESLFQANARDF